MALGKRSVEQQELWVATTELPKSPGHPFYRRLNALLAEAGFDAWIEALCASHYSQGKGRPSIPPGVYFRMILVGYFEGISSQRGIAWRCSDSFSLREFLGVPPTEESPDHSSLTRVHQRLPQPKRKHRSRWTDKPADFKQAVLGNRRRVRRDKGRRLQRQRSELCERTFAHVCETGGARKCWLRGLAKVTKRYLLQAAARNLGLILRKLFNLGTPRGLQGEGGASSLAQIAYLTRWMRLVAVSTHAFVTHHAQTEFSRPTIGIALAA